MSSLSYLYLKPNVHRCALSIVIKTIIISIRVKLARAYI